VRVSSVPWEAGWSAASFAPEPPEDLRWARWGSSEAGDAVHGFVDDWRLEALARGSLGGLGSNRCWATEPDFSVSPGQPEIVQRWQVYRARYCGDLLRRQGLSVLPVITWTGDDPVHWTAWGIAPGSWIAVRAPGADREAWSWWRLGFRSSVELLRPAGVLVFGVASRVGGVLEGVGIPWRRVRLRARRQPLSRGR
jgi:hypothetical protein